MLCVSSSSLLQIHKSDIFLCRLYLHGYTDLMFESVGGNTRTDLHQEDDAEEDGEGEGHAVVLLDGAAAPEEGHEEDDAADDDEEDGGGEELVPEEVEVLAVGALHHAARHDQEQARQLTWKLITRRV